ncbi:two-component sensor histidine kinase [Caulobacter ginsengisoli]|uniref:histidine kinase n=1 Tax=Caulobacter ginsengisoli TaxID=400775 RepID=A0ABU0IU62_9CAUL|nr:sensor histidine kinase [Caulobacter ginsengisoli]MDQ0464896.1 two-component sensor histidine kinase [Caulobacter ginsengisoli]
MKSLRRPRWGPATTIRVRLGLALALALLPVLVLGAAQSVLSFNHETQEAKSALQAAAQRSAATTKARMESAGVLLETLSPGSVGLNCAHLLHDISQRLPGYANLIRFDANGRVVCAAESVPADPQRRNRPWFARLPSEASMTLVSRPGIAYAREPAILAAVRSTRPDGSFDGALAAVIPLTSLRPELDDPGLPADAEVAIADRAGQVLSATRLKAFPNLPAAWTEKALKSNGVMAYARDREGRMRVFSIAPLVGDELFVVLSAPSQGLISWAQLNPLSGVVFPLLAFLLALVTVMLVTEQAVIRWIAYLQRVAAIYARGRFTVRPLAAERAPPEIRDLAETLDAMAATIVARDSSLHDSLAHKDSLMREIHHRVKNNLQVISSLLSMQERSLSDPAARQAMSDTRQRITALALIYRALYQGPDLKRVDLGPFLEELTAQLLVGEMAPHPTIATEMHADPLIIDPDKLAPLALFSVEAITNAQKHGLSARGGLLRVEFCVMGPEAELIISDDGGTSRGAQATPAEAVERKGVGRTLMTAFARQLRGRVVVEANDFGGLTARLTFPTPEAGTDL